MALHVASPMLAAEPRWQSNLFVKVLILATGAGYVIGATIGTTVWPIVCTAIYGIAGGAIGAAAGAVVGMLAVGIAHVAKVAPLMHLGSEPLRVGPGLRFIYRAVIACTALGAVAGLVIGLVSYPPTAPFAVVEGAILGACCGPLIGVIFAPVAILMARIEHRERDE